MPQMNFFDATLSLEDGKYFVNYGEMKVELSADKQENLRAKGVEAQDITLGVRPNHIRLSESGENCNKATVDVSEMMGSEIHLHVNAYEKDVVIIVSTMKMADHGISGFKHGEEILFDFGGNVCHVFDKDGNNLEK